MSSYSAEPDSRQGYGYFSEITTRWMDNDIYGHVNNVVYYSYFDSIANRYLIEEGGLNIAQDNIIGFVVSSSCEYKSPVAYPELLEAGFRVNRIGNSSAEYGIGIFIKGAAIASAYGTFTHVFVDRSKDKSVPIPTKIRAALEVVLI